MAKDVQREPTLFESIFPVLFLIVLLSFNVYIFGDDSLLGSNQIVLIISGSVGALVALRMGIGWKVVRKGEKCGILILSRSVDITKYRLGKVSN